MRKLDLKETLFDSFQNQMVEVSLIYKDDKSKEHFIKINNQHFMLQIYDDDPNRSCLISAKIINPEKYYFSETYSLFLVVCQNLEFDGVLLYSDDSKADLIGKFGTTFSEDDDYWGAQGVIYYDQESLQKKRLKDKISSLD